MQKRNKLIKRIGNAFIALSFLGFILVYYPVIKTYLFPQTPDFDTNNPYIVIEKINTKAPIVYNVDPWEKQEYLEALSHGIAHAKNTSLPGEKGTVYLFAHSSDAPWRITRYNTIFLRLHELEQNDLIKIITPDKEYNYSVVDIKSVWPNEIEYLTQAKDDQLILQTCTPIGTDLKRLLVFAEPID